MLLFILIIWILSAVFSYSFFYLNILPGMNPYYLFLVVCLSNTLFYVLYNKEKINWREYGGKSFGLFFNFFVFWSALYILISFINLPKFFNLDDLLFDQSYIIRHASYLPSLAIMFCVYLYTVRTQSIENFKKNHLILLLIVLQIITLIIGKDNIVYTQLIVILSSLFFIKEKSYFSFLVLIYFVLIETETMSSFIIASSVIIIILLFGKNIPVLLAKDYNLKIFMVSFFLILLMVSFKQPLFELISSDENSLWRFNVWSNEFRNLIQTFGIGVGYGAAYVDNNIYYEVDNSTMYASISGLFVVANHNTIINMFYRLGFVGGIVFVLMNLTLVKWFAKTYVMNTAYNKYLIWAFANYIYNFIIISLNPGLESPRFSFGYLISMGLLIGFIIKSRSTSLERELIK